MPSLELVSLVASAGGLPLQVGGGYRSTDAIASALEAGASRVMAGTAALSAAFLDDAATRFGEGLIVAIDVRDGKVAIDGWTRSSELTAATLAGRCSTLGLLACSSRVRRGTGRWRDLISTCSGRCSPVGCR